jgi:hypothetical protein
MKTTINGFITYRAPRWKDAKPEVSFLTYDPTDYDKTDDNPRIVVREHSFEIEIPDDFDPRPKMVAALVAAKEKARADFAAQCVAYDRRINELLALDNCVEAA